MAQNTKTSKKMTVEEAGRMGGEKVARERGSEFYSEIGRIGGQSQGKATNPGNFANDPEKAREAGRRGGESRSKALEEDHSPPMM
ncbi:MAG: general stress protein [Patescibacteria group bacterium]